MALKQIQYIGEGGGGGGGGVVVVGLQVVCEAHIQGGKYRSISPEKIDHLILIMYLVLQIFSVGSHCQGIVTSYLPSTPI